MNPAFNPLRNIARRGYLLLGVAAWLLFLGFPPLVSAQTGPTKEEVESEVPAKPTEAEPQGVPSQPDSQGSPEAEPAVQESEDETPEDEAPPELSEVERWTARLEELSDGLVSGEKTSDDADALYQQLAEHLRERRAQFHEALIAQRHLSDFISLNALYNTVIDLYALRIRLLAELSPDLYSQITGTSVRGVRALRGEIGQVLLDVRYQNATLSQRMSTWFEGMVGAPLPVIWQFVQLLVVLMLFRYWRSWASDGMTKVRSKLLQVRPRTFARLRLARFVWYVDRVRKPLEWLALAELVFRLVEVPMAQARVGRLLTILQWILVAWFVVSLINALSARGAAGISGKTARLRLASLSLLAAWVVLLGLGLSLASSYAGQGTLYAWVWLVYKILAFPVLVALILMWRKTIFQKLEFEPESVRTALRHRKGLRGYLTAALGGIYLLALYLLRSSLGVLGEVEWGKRLVAILYRAQVASAEIRGGAASSDLEPISDETKKLIRVGEGAIIEEVAKIELERLTRMAEEGRGGGVAIVADRGLGKSLLLQRIKDRVGAQALVIECPPDGHTSLLRKMAKNLGMSDGEPSVEEIAKRIQESDLKVVALDSFHRMTRPVMGGQQELDELSKLGQMVDRRVLWVFAMNKASWLYIACARGRRMTLEEIFEIPSWNEQQIGSLIELRCKEMKMEPSFDHLALPRRLDYGDFDTPAERNRFGFYRLLWDASGGSPKAALRLWADSLVRTSDGELRVRQPPAPATAELEAAGIHLWLVLRVIIQCELASHGDIVESLRISEGEARSALRFALLKGWIEDKEGRYSITDRWYAPVSRVLSRQNLLAH